MDPDFRLSRNCWAAPVLGNERSPGTPSPPDRSKLQNDRTGSREVGYRPEETEARPSALLRVAHVDEGDVVDVVVNDRANRCSNHLVANAV